ncbi:MAG: excinuclease ABC subunit UvrC [Eubacteriales bacterium]|jgi:excinuclease ABC subunit C|nr:excinuclease ABC subunit UvrC [Eubacteriales bacterium]
MNGALLEKSGRLPLSPGVYLMKNKSGNIIYVGKSKVLRQRVSQYFQENPKHDIKTQKMIEAVYDFDYMITDSEIEALALENRLIKLHKPKFNIKLKDAKSYPYIKVTINDEYPRMYVVRTRQNDNARYFGPYSGSGPAYSIMKTAQKTFGAASCKKEFPRDIGKSRPCLYSQLGHCATPCSGKVTSEEYRESFRDIITFLRGSFGDVKRSLQDKMEFASENLLFETAALCRDRIRALDALWEKQKVVGPPDADYDVFALYTEERCSCLAVFYVRAGSVIDNEHFIFPAEQIADDETVTTFIGDLYNKRGYIPREILLGFPVRAEHEHTLAAYIHQLGGRTKIRRPERGDLRALCDMVYENAVNRAVQYLAESEKDNKMLIKLAQLLSLEVVPQRIEAYDISNMGGENTVAGMIVSEDGKLRRSCYRTYNIKTVEGQDDYASMREAVERRMKHKNETLPDLILLDGGKGHVSTIRNLLEELEIDIPVFGMVKDEYHKTRALTSDSEDISIAREQSVFTFIYKLQEEVHRYTLSKMTVAKGAAYKRYALEDIKGIGPVKAKELLSHFKTMTKLKSASKEELLGVRGINEQTADAIIAHFAAQNK